MRANFNIPGTTTITLAALAWLLLGCSENAANCAETRTCSEPPEEGDGGSTGVDSTDGSEVDETGKSPDPGDGDHETTGDGDGDETSDDDEPEPCAEGTWDHDEDPDTACTAWTTCEAGEFVSDEGTPTSDRACSTCGSGFSEEENAEECTRWTECPSGVLVAGTATTDAECASPAIDVAVGDGFSCILREEGTVACWGKNDLGQLGRGDTEYSGLPQAVMVDSQDGLEPLTGVVQLSAGAAFACALRDNGSVWCWGANEAGQLGTGTYEAGDFEAFGSPIDGLASVIKIDAGVEHSCALLEDATARCWGASRAVHLGDFGYGTDKLATVIAPDPPPADQVPFEGLLDIAAGGTHSCVVDADRKGRCWGLSKDRGGSPEVSGSQQRPTEPVDQSEDMIAVAAGDFMSCWLHEDGGVSCHGAGRLGTDEPDTWIWSPTVVVEGDGSLGRAKDVSADLRTRCILFEAGVVSCWGANDYGQLGDGTTEASAELVPVDGLEDIIAIDAGYSHVCAVQDTGRVYCWGKNENGELGDNTIFQSSAPVTVPNVDHVKALTSGSDHSCALLDNGKVKCWGKNDLGQLGIGSNTAMSPPLQLGISDVIQVSSHQSLTYAVKEDHTLRVWGTNMDGTISFNTVENVSEPTDVVAVATGSRHACGIKTNGELVCWGSNQNGALGRSEGFETDTTWGAGAVEGIAHVVSVDAGSSHSCALSGDEVQCWGGSGDGQSGPNGYVDSASPTTIELPAVTQVATGDYFSLALTKQGTIAAWGSNWNLQLGVVTSYPQNEDFVWVTGIEDAVAIAAGGSHACAVVEGGATKCWGYNSVGQIGAERELNNSSTPVIVPGLTSTKAISAGGYHTCALQTEGTVSCWGSNEFYQLGHDRVASSPFPREVIWQ